MTEIPFVPVRDAFWPSSQRQSRHALLALDTAMAGVSAWGALAALGQPALHAFAATWFAAALAAWGLTRVRESLFDLDAYSRALLAPLLTVALTLLLAAVMRTPYSLHFELLAGGMWTAGLLITRVTLRRMGPRVRVGMLNCTSRTLNASGRVQAFPVTAETFDAGALDVLALAANDPLDGDARPLVAHCALVNIPVRLTAELEEELTGKVSTEFLHGQHLEPLRLTFDYLPLKRALDLLVTLLLLPALLPVLLVTALLVLLDVGAPVLFWQTRAGQHGRPFRLVKFRTMRADSERAGAAFAQTGDPRVSRLGRVLRTFRLDELPQFYNIARGEMSLIGPRPEQLGFAQDFERDIPLYGLRHWVKPGLTGWAQVRHGYAAGTAETMVKLRYDVYYVKHLSLWLDLRILIRTALTVLTGFGAR